VAYEEEEWWLAAGKEGGSDGVGRWKRIQRVVGPVEEDPMEVAGHVPAKSKEKENSKKRKKAFGERRKNN
jgi:hypothetical protein